MGAIYKILNICNNDFYIGSAIDYRRRLREHKSMLNKNKHHCKYLQNAVNKYGIENFVMVKVEDNIANTSLINIEQFYIDNLNPKYNSNPVAGSSLGFKHSNETKIKISKSRLGNKWGVGKIWTEESKSKLREARSILVKQYDLTGKLINIFSSMKEASEKTGVNIYYIKEYSKKSMPDKNGFVWVRMMDLKRLGEANPYPSSKDASTGTTIEPTADGLKL